MVKGNDSFIAKVLTHGQPGTLNREQYAVFERLWRILFIFNLNK